MTRSSDPDDKNRMRSQGKLVLPSLAISRFAIQHPGIVTSLLLIDVGLTFGRPVAIIGQIRTVAFAVTVVFALFVGVLSVRFKHKSLLVTGLAVCSIAALGCGLAPDFDILLLFYSLTGLGTAMVVPMNLTLVAENFSLKKRATTIGWIMTIMSLAFVIGPPIVALVDDFGGWRLAFLGFVLPVSLVSVLFAAIGLPPAQNSIELTPGKERYLEGFREVLLNRSANACLIGAALSMATYQAVLMYGPSFFRQRFLVSSASASFLMLAGASCYAVGTQAGGRFVGRVGEKAATASTALFAGLFIATYTNMPELWMSAAFSFLGSFFAGMRMTSSNSLTLEQVPRFPGTMMSISSAADSLGMALGAGFGGLALLVFGYGPVGVWLGGMGIAAALVIQTFASDVKRNEAHGDDD